MRMLLCYELAQSKALLHSVGWIRRAIRSDNVLFFKKDSSEILDLSLVDPRLCGFEASRPESDISTIHSCSERTLIQPVVQARKVSRALVG
jgi:serine/threonine protein kinase